MTKVLMSYVIVTCMGFFSFLQIVCVMMILKRYVKGRSKKRSRDSRRDSDQRIIVSSANKISLTRVVSSDESEGSHHKKDDHGKTNKILKIIIVFDRKFCNLI